MKARRFQGEVYAGHTTDCGVIVPFDASLAWPSAPVLPIGYRKLVGHAVRGSIDGAGFDSWVFRYHRQWRLVVPAAALQQAGIAAGDRAAFLLRPHPRPREVAQFVPGPKRSRTADAAPRAARGRRPPRAATAAPRIAAAARIASSLPDVTVGTRHGNRTWLVGDKGFAWERPFSKADLRRFGSDPVPAGPILAVRVADLLAKEALLATAARGVFTIPHFDGYAAVLIQLELVAARDLKRLITDAWLACVPSSMATGYRVRSRRH